MTLALGWRRNLTQKRTALIVGGWDATGWWGCGVVKRQRVFLSHAIRAAPSAQQRRTVNTRKLTTKQWTRRKYLSKSKVHLSYRHLFERTALIAF